MRGVNTVILIGNATRDAELRHTKSGKAVSNIRIATNRKVGGEEQTQYHTIIVRLVTAQRIAAGSG
jgi:single-stranded DNA-binding protein